MANGLFAEHGLDVEIMEPAPGPANVRRVAAGGSELCLTSVAHYLTARQQAGPLAARFVAVVVQRSPLSGIVAAGSDITEPAHLAGRRTGGPADSQMVAEYQAELGHLGFAPAELVAVPYGDAPAALGRGEVDVVPDFVDLVPRTRRQAGIPVRAVPLGTEVYASGVVAADDLPADVVDTVVTALRAALERQREDPRGGLEQMGERYPEADPHEAVEGWSLVEPNIFTGVEPLSMDAGRWAETVALVTSALGFAPVDPLSVYRPDLAATAASVSAE